MTTEESPLLTNGAHTNDDAADRASKHDELYSRFSDSRKRGIVALVSATGLVPLFVTGSFIPSIPHIAKDLGTTAAVVNLAVSISFLATALGTLFWSINSGFYGRRLVYLCGIPLLVIGSLGVAVAQTVTHLMISRVLQGFGSSGGLSIGAAVIGDLYKLEQRGTALGIFFAATLLGPALAPVTGGPSAVVLCIVGHYFSWRNMQLGIGLAGLAIFISLLLYLPETTHPNTRGIDKGPNPGRFRFVWLNPVGSLGLLRSPNLLAVTFIGTSVLLTDYVLLVPLAYTIGKAYNIHNEALIGLCFFPCGLGNIIGAPLAGHISDKILVKWRKRRGGEWVPEDRLRASLVGAAIFVPMSILLSGVFTRFVSGTVGLVLNLLCLFMNGIGVDFVLTPCSAYVVDIMHARSAESIAAMSSTRGVLLALGVASIGPMIATIGHLATDLVAAVLAWLGFGLIVLTIRNGGAMRGWVDVGYSTAQDN